MSGLGQKFSVLINEVFSFHGSMTDKEQIHYTILCVYYVLNSDTWKLCWGVPAIMSKRSLNGS